MPHSLQLNGIVPEDGQLSAERLARVRVKNRRQTWLENNPSYFHSPELELADPLLFDRCVRRFQTAAERELDGRKKGYSGVLEADIYRSEAKLAALGGQLKNEMRETAGSGALTSDITYIRGPCGEVLPEDADEIPKSKEDGMERWKHEITMRFIRGDDVEFSYKEVDECDELDVVEEKEAEERWFDDEEPEWVQSDDNHGGDTGIQDF